MKKINAIKNIEDSIKAIENIRVETDKVKLEAWIQVALLNNGLALDKLRELENKLNNL